MIWRLLFTILAAWGLLSALWAGFGWMLSGSSPITLVLLCPKAHTGSILARLRWLNWFGLLRCRILLPGYDPADLPRQYENTEFCTLAELSARIEAEREQID